MGFVDDMIARSQSLWDRARPAGKARNVVKADSWDRDTWEDLLVDVPLIGKQIAEINRTHDYVADSHADLFQMLHQGDPLLRKRREMDERFLPNHTLVGEFADNPITAELRTYTRHDEMATAMALVTMKPAIEETYKRLESAQEQAEEAAAKREQAAQMLAQLLPGVLGDPGEDGDGDPDSNGTVAVPVEGSANGPLTEAEQAEADAQLQAAMDAASKLLDEADSHDAGADADATSAASALSPGTQAAVDELAEEEQLTKAFGMEDGELQRMDFDERVALLKLLRGNRLAEFAKQLGAFRTIAAGRRRRRVKSRPEEIVSVTLGDELTRLTPTEYVNLATPELEGRFDSRYIEKQLQVWEMEGVEIQGRGPIIVVCDESQSMTHPLGGGTRESWSKALALGLCDTARHEKRDFIYIGFSSMNQVWRSDFLDGKGGIDKVVEFTEHFFSGGTSYEPPLTLAKTIVMEYVAKRKPKPDIVFITDDEYTASEPFLEDWERVREKSDMTVYGVAMGKSFTPGGAMDRLSTNVRSLADLAPGEDAAADLFRLI